MKEKRFTLFWKKLIVMNLCLSVILVRIFSMVYSFLSKKSSNVSIFSQQTENGYPFFDSINCDIRELIQIIDSITTENINKTTKNQDSIIFNSFINDFKSYECSFYDKLNICKDNKKCFNELNQMKIDATNDNKISFNYHFWNNEGILKISNLIQIFRNKNEFYHENKIKIEIEPYYKLISGYYSYLGIKLYQEKEENKNYDILREITNYEDKVNNLFYLHSLFLKAQSIIYPNKIYLSSKKDSIKYINNCLRESEDQFTNKNSLFYSSEKNKQKLLDIIENDLKNVINCIPDFSSRYSYSVDIHAIKTMIKIILGLDENISKNDKKIFNFYLKELSKSIKTIFIADIEIRKKANIYEKYQPYFIIIFICISFGGLVFINRYFIKYKEYYNQGSKILEKYKMDRYNHMYNTKHHQYWAKRREMEEKKKEEEMKNKTKNDENNNEKMDDNIQGDKDKCTKEELEYIKKLANEHKGDFILSK